MFKALHKPGSPVILAIVYDTPSARAVASLPTAQAIATPSYAVAEAAGLKDDELTKKTNLAAAKTVVSATTGFKKPFTVDFRDGHGDDLEDATAELIKLAVVGVNLEDCDKNSGKMYSQAQAVAREKRVNAVARSHGVPEFVASARCITFIHGG
jgi:PEP phosphonomutase and related enzymes